jgi:hypothetical protein
MSHGKHLTLEEARQKKQLERFAKLNPSEGNKEVFDALLDAMAGKKKSD